jgi:hypothetical protein
MSLEDNISELNQIQTPTTQPYTARGDINIGHELDLRTQNSIGTGDFEATVIGIVLNDPDISATSVEIAGFNIATDSQFTPTATPYAYICNIPEWKEPFPDPPNPNDSTYLNTLRAYVPKFMFRVRPNQSLEPANVGDLVLVGYTNSNNRIGGYYIGNLEKARGPLYSPTATGAHANGRVNTGFPGNPDEDRTKGIYSATKAEVDSKGPGIIVDGKRYNHRLRGTQTDVKNFSEDENPKITSEKGIGNRQKKALRSGYKKTDGALTGIVLHETAGHTRAKGSAQYAAKQNAGVLKGQTHGGGGYHFIIGIENGKVQCYQLGDPVRDSIAHAGNPPSPVTVGVCVASPSTYNSLCKSPHSKAPFTSKEDVKNLKPTKADSGWWAPKTYAEAGGFCKPPENIVTALEDLVNFLCDKIPTLPLSFPTRDLGPKSAKRIDRTTAIPPGIIAHYDISTNRTDGRYLLERLITKLG